MANEKEPTPGTRGWRVDQIRKRLGLSREAFADALASVADRWELNEGGKWDPSRVSKVLLGRKPIALTEAAAVMMLARVHGIDDLTWDWLVLGIEHLPVGALEPAPKTRRQRSTRRS